MSHSPGARKKRSRSDAEGPIDINELQTYLSSQEANVRATASDMVNKELAAHAEIAKGLDEKAAALDDYTAALDSGFVRELRKALMACYRFGVRLEVWVNTFTPPLSVGGNAGVSAEVQEGIYQNIHQLTAGCGDALSRMLAYEKEHAMMKTKCTDEAIWERYKATLQDSQLHECTKAALQLRQDIMMMGNCISNNISHLRSDVASDGKLATMY